MKRRDAWINSRHHTTMKTQIFFRLVTVVGILGAYVGYVTVDRYEALVRAILGLTVLYLLYREHFVPKRVANERIGDWTEFPYAIRALVVSFFETIIAFWACIQVVHVIWYLRDIFIGR